ncbi:MAG: hypothetical protein JNK11_04995 [Alphaproteobacteria bacterium]|nr:hypothetical protein [Alphaproteobacteria bacterium]
MNSTVIRRYDIDEDEAIGRAALDRSLAKQRAAGAPTAPGVAPLPAPLDAELLDIERIDESDSDRLDDLDIHFGNHGWKCGAPDAWA